MDRKNSLHNMFKLLSSEKMAAFFHRRDIRLVLATASGIFFLILSIVFAIGYWQISGQKQAEEHLQSEITQLAKLDDYQNRQEKLKSLYKFSRNRLGFVPPELKYWLLLYSWEERLHIFDKLLFIKYNDYLEKDTKNYREKVEKKLNILKSNCTDTIQDLERQPQSDSLWKFYNLSGCASVLIAYLAIEFEENREKGTSALQEAIDDYKRAIRLVDASSLSGQKRLLPRWNLELITGRGQLRQLSRRQDQSNDARKVFEQLEVVTPEEFGGYAPGVPMDSQVEK